MKNITDLPLTSVEHPIRVVQFGEGNFLRAFVDYMLDIANEKGVFDGSVAIVKPISAGSLDNFKHQSNRYTVILRGKENGQTVTESRIVTSISKALDCTEDHDEFLELAECPTVRFIVSNTTEAGIVLDERDFSPTTLSGVPHSYPGKLTKFLYHRFSKFGGSADKGVIILPVELIENNGGKLKACVHALAEKWAISDAFTDWLDSSCIFCSTLVDRIVTGFPKNEIEALWASIGYRDALLDVGEPFGLWVIECPKGMTEAVQNELPLDKIGLPVIFTNDQKPYRERKVRVLNGAHTASVLAGYLCGLDIVRDMMHDQLMGSFVRRVVLDEIVPLVPLPTDEVRTFADSVFERFENPFIDHALLSISLNSVSKWRARVLPSFRDFVSANGQLPPLMTFSFAALLAFYSGNITALTADGLHARRSNGDEYVIVDDRNVLEFFAENCCKDDLVALTASNTAFWGEDLTKYDGFVESVNNSLKAIKVDANAAVHSVLED